MLESDVARAAPRAAGSGSIAVSAMNDELLDAAIRLLRLLGSPRDIPILAPLADARSSTACSAASRPHA